MAFDLLTDLSELVKGELAAALGQLLNDLSDLVAGQRQVCGLEELIKFLFADVSIVVHIWERTGSKVTGNVL